MVIWFTGESGAGKTTAAKELLSQMNNAVHLDGDDVRQVWTDLAFTEDDRYENNLRVARLARLLASQGLNVVVSTICPAIRDLRAVVKKISGCKFIHL